VFSFLGKIFRMIFGEDEVEEKKKKNKEVELPPPPPPPKVHPARRCKYWDY